MTNLSGANLNSGAAVGPQGEGMDSPSSFPAYPTYKDSSVKWLGVVPENWALGSLKHLAWIRNGRDYKEVESPDGEYPVIGSGGQFANATRYLYDGESVLLGRKGTIDKPLYIHGRFWTVDTMFYTEVAAGASAKFLYYNALTIPFQYYSTSTALPSMTQGDLLNHPCAIPALEEQNQIARFLDHETARIDALIEEQQRLIELLKEKRQAVISLAVTKGLDPTVPMKDSGVEWLGEVPAHWEVTRLRRICVEINDINHVMPVAVESGVPFLSAKDLLDDGTLNFTEDIKMISESDFMTLSKKICPRRGDIIYSRIGACLGKARLVETDDRFLVSYSCCVVRVIESIACPRFIQHLLDGEMILTEARMRTQGIGVPDLGLGEIGRFPIALPPVREQQLIARYLDDKAGKFDTLTTEAKRATNLLQEHRSALISAAVTGKIDVRDWQSPASAPTPELAQEAM